MTYNIQGHAAGRRPDHLPKIAETIAAAAPDVVGLQEVHAKTRLSSLVNQGEILAGLTGMNLAFGKSTMIEGGDYGNAVLTKHEITQSHVYLLPGSGEQRSLLHTTIRIDGVEMTFFVTHLAAWGRLLRLARLRQIAELGDITARDWSPHILVGDFNVPPGAEEMRTLLTHGHLRPVGDSKEATFPLTRQRLDYIFCDPRWTLVSSEVIRRGPSDHWPVIANLELRTD